MATTQMARWGNSLAVRIPKAVASDAQLQAGDSVSVAAAAEGGLIIRPAHRKLRLRQLVRQINAANLHGHTDWGDAQGREVW